MACYCPGRLQRRQSANCLPTLQQMPDPSPPIAIRQRSRLGQHACVFGTGSEKAVQVGDAEAHVAVVETAGTRTEHPELLPMAEWMSLYCRRMGYHQLPPNIAEVIRNNKSVAKASLRSEIFMTQDRGTERTGVVGAGGRLAGTWGALKFELELMHRRLPKALGGGIKPAVSREPSITVRT